MEFDERAEDRDGEAQPSGEHDAYAHRQPEREIVEGELQIRFADQLKHDVLSRRVRRRFRYLRV